MKAVKTLAALLVLSALAAAPLGCRAPKWETSKADRAPDRDLAVALGDLAYGRIQDIQAADVPVVAAPQSLRPCCAFGTGLTVKVGTVPIPGVELGNIVGLDDLGPHVYDNGFLSINAADNRALVDNEQNGLIYSCRGGFIDIAHVRDNADLMIFMLTAIGRGMDGGADISVPDQGGRITVRVNPLGEESVRRYGRERLAMAITEWVIFELSIWHEIATWYGYSSIEQWPEKISAFSPEDLYSNLVGIKISAGIMNNNRAGDETDYNRSMDAWIKRALQRLEAVSKDESIEVMNLVDGLWWDSSRRIPDWTLTRRRHMEIGTTVTPWLFSNATGLDADDAADFEACDDAGPPLVLRNPDGFEGHRFADHITVEIDLNDKLAAVFPLQNPPSRIVTQADFPAVVEVIRAANAEEFGVGADQP